MGSFSWTRAEATTKRSNLTYGDIYKILVPKEFGGGYIRDIYYDYGIVFGHRDRVQSAIDPRYYCYVDSDGVTLYPYPVADLYGILAYWNDCKDLIFDGDDRPQTMNEILLRGRTADDGNRCEGIHIGCYAHEIDDLKFPLKLVSASYKGTYEDCKGRSYGDPNQGFGKFNWSHSDYTNILEKLQLASSETDEVTALRQTQIGIQLADCCAEVESLKQLVKFEDSEVTHLVDIALGYLTILKDSLDK